MQHGTSTSTSPRTAWYIFRANNLRLFLEMSAHWPSGPRCLNTIKGLCDGLPHCPCWLTGLVDSDLPCFRIGASVDGCRANAHSGHGSLPLSSTKVLAAARVTWKSVLLKAVLSWRSPSLRDTIAHISYNELSMKHNRPRAQTDRDTRSHPHAHTSLHLSSIVGK